MKSLLATLALLLGFLSLPLRAGEIFHGPQQSCGWPVRSDFRIRFKDWNAITNVDAGGNVFQFRTAIQFQRETHSDIVTCIFTNTCTSTNAIAFGGTNQWGFGAASGLDASQILKAVEDTNELGAGRIISVECNTLNLQSRRGQLYIQCEICVWPDTSFPEMGWPMFRDYLTGNNHIGWDCGKGGNDYHQVSGRGFIHNLVGTDPAAGSEISETVPTNIRRHLYGLRFSLVADANAANRTVRLIIDDGTTSIFDRFCKVVQTAGQTMAYQAWPMGFDITAAEGSSANQLFIILPDGGIDLFQGSRIRTLTTNIQVGDNFSAPDMYVEDWIEE